ncbi:hypothetical protein [Arthrobacter sp. GMC3]|uniref:hypothetical protein n=1 Tax=Arthrobacter sp. GMC3 TaxID=2058894 RepID=UPI000CE3CDD2|nr:hypothetical protein [Arthrobacter sp. GMC3]
MNSTPRGANRFLLALLGLVFMAVGAGLVAVAAIPAAARWWQDFAGPLVGDLSDFTARTHLTPDTGSWAWLVVAVALLLVVIVMVTWIANQGKGRTDVLFTTSGSQDDDGAAGRVVLSSAVAEQALKRALLERSDLLSVSVTSYDFRGQSCLRVRVLPRQGVAPHLVAAEVGATVEAMDALVGVQAPVLLSIGSGARSRFTKAERVR